MYKITALLLLLWSCCAAGKILGARVERDDRYLQPIEISEPFGFGARGQIEITLTDAALYRRHDQTATQYNLGNFGFFLFRLDPDQPVEAWDADALASKCLLTEGVKTLFTFDQKDVKSLIEKKTSRFTFQQAVVGGGYFGLYFVSCEPETPVSFHVRVEMFNLTPNQKRNYLSVGEAELDVVYWVRTTVG